MNQNLFSRAYALMPLANRSKGFWIIFLMVVNAFLDFFSIAFFLPLIFLIINPDFITTNAVAAELYHYIGIASVSSFVIILTIGVLLFILLKNLASVWIVRVKVAYAFDIGQNLASRALAKYIAISFLDFSQVDFTRELNRITNYPFSFANNIVLPLTTLISEICLCLLFLIWMTYYEYKMLLLVFIILIPAFLIYQSRKKSLEKINRDLKDKYPALLKSALQVVEGYPEIRTYNKASFFQNKFQHISNALTQTFIKDQTLQAGTVRLTEIMVGVITCSLIIFTVSTYQDYQQTLLLLSLYCGASFRMIPSANRILHSSQQLRMHRYLLQELDVKPNLEFAGSAEGVVAPASFNHTLSLKNISFHYPNGHVALKNISLTIRKGEKVAIIGNSGQGKTSLLLLLLGFLKQNEGEILVDDALISDENSWRKLLGYVPQNPYIVDGTVSENIAFGIPPNQIDRSKIISIINDLDLTELIQQLPQGIDSRIGERGAKLSGGQRQRLAIGRALYSDASILLLDEVTNQVHLSVELEIMKLLDRLSYKKKTIIMVTHRIADESFFDSIYKLEKGAIYEQALRTNINDSY